MKISRRLKKIVFIAIILTDIAGLLCLFGITERKFYSNRFGTFTFIAALNTLLYYLFAMHDLKRHHSGVFIPGWRYSVFADTTMIALYGLIYMRSAYGEADKSLKTGLILLWIVMPVLLLIEWLINEKKHTHYRFILIAMFLPVVYVTTALIMGSLHHGIGIAGNNWPYPFMNVDQLGWPLAVESIIVRFIIWFIYCWLLVRTDRYLGRKKH